MSGLNNKLQNIRHYFNRGVTRPLAFRQAQLKALKACILKYEEEIYAALYKDLHKSKEEVCITETGMVLSEINTMLKNLEDWMQPQSIPTNLANLPSKSFLYSEPLGVVLIIAPWNYPFQLLLMPLAGAIAAGNCVVLKPSELAKATEAVMEKIITETFSTDYILYVPGAGTEMVPALMDHFRYDHVFYTGSTKVGRIIYKKAAEQLSPVTLELGGKSPCVVTPEASLKIAAKRIVNVKFSNAGQMCITPDYVLVHRSVKDAFVALLKETIRKFYGLHPIDSYDFGRIINKTHFDRLNGLLEGQTIIYGGGHNEDQLYIAPTLIDNPSPDSAVMNEEIFGPILPVITYETEQQALELIHKNENPLAFYIFTNNRKEAERWIRSVPFGGGCVNQAAVHYLNKKLPFGGRGNSGIGRYHGKYSFDTFSHQKSVLKATSWPDIPLGYPPLKGKLKTLKRVL